MAAIPADEVAAIRELLVGAVACGVGRAAAMGVVEFTRADATAVRLHSQCAYRVLRHDDIAIASGDMRCTRSGAGEDAFDQFDTVYDARALIINRMLRRLRPVVTEAVFGRAGSLTVEWEHGFALELLPDLSRVDELWRVLVPGGEHYGYPSERVR